MSDPRQDHPKPPPSPKPRGSASPTPSLRFSVRALDALRPPERSSPTWGAWRETGKTATVYTRHRDGIGAVVAGIHRDGAKSILNIINRQVLLATTVSKIQKQKVTVKKA